MIRFEQVSFSYAPAELSRPAVDSLSLQIHSGERLAVLGANGSGKSTMVRLANALLLPVAGEVSVEGMVTADPKSADTIRERVSVVFQNPDDQIVATSVEDDVAFGPENLGLPRPEIRRRVDVALEAVGLVGLERREPHLLSGGQKQRLAIAGALAMGSQYLFLDEPTSMLDPTGRAEVLDVLAQVAQSGRAVVHVTHDLSEALRAHRALVMHRGVVVFDGAPTDLLHSPDLLADWGLELPPIVRLADELRLRGAEIPLAATTPAEIAAAL